MSRRPGHRFSRRSPPVVAGSGAAPGGNPSAILGASLLQWCRADLGLTIGVGFDWLDQGPGGKHYTQAVAATGPSLNAADATLSNLPTLTFNGVAQFCQSTLQLPAPGTTPTLLWLIFKQGTWTSNDILVSADDGVEPSIRQSATTPNMRIYSGTLGPVNGGAALTVWRRAAAYFTNSTSDYLKLGATTTTGTNTGNGADGTATRKLGCGFTPSNFAHITVAEIVYANSDAQLAALDAYGAARYGSGLF